MRLTFCFSRNCRPYPTIFAFRSRPCCPGEKFLFSIPHDGLKQRSPLRNNFIPSRRQSLQTGPMYLANVVSPCHSQMFHGPCSMFHQTTFKLFFSLADGIRCAESASHHGLRALPSPQSAMHESRNRVLIRVL